MRSHSLHNTLALYADKNKRKPDDLYNDATVTPKPQIMIKSVREW